MIFFTSDTHFGHHNIISHSSRPFKNIEEMDNKIISNWNEIITSKDEVWHLGDFCHQRNRDLIIKMANQLNGKIHLVMGNHDERHKMIKSDGKWLPVGLFESVQEYKELSFENPFSTGISPNFKIPFILSHYPMSSWNKKSYGSIMLHGHCHGCLKEKIPNRFDVGVDCNNFMPIPFTRFFSYEVKESR